jgi:hypothetical protein
MTRLASVVERCLSESCYAGNAHGLRLQTSAIHGNSTESDDVWLAIVPRYHL